VSATFFPNPNTTGVRRLNNLAGIPVQLNQGVRRLQALGWLGSVLDTEASMVAEGYSQGDLDVLVAIGATDAQLQSLWNCCSPGTPEYADAYAALVDQITGNRPAPAKPATSAPAYPVSAQPQPLPTGTQFQNALKASGAVPVGILSTTPPSQLQVNQPAAPALLLPPSPPPTLQQWFTGNANWIILVFAALVLGPPLIKKL
jgi:hypothetical protein